MKISDFDSEQFTVRVKQAITRAVNRAVLDNENGLTREQKAIAAQLGLDESAYAANIERYRMSLS